jgi:hypothetical protein
MEEKTFAEVERCTHAAVMTLTSLMPSLPLAHVRHESLGKRDECVELLK